MRRQQLVHTRQNLDLFFFTAAWNALSGFISSQFNVGLGDLACFRICLLGGRCKRAAFGVACVIRLLAVVMIAYNAPDDIF